MAIIILYFKHHTETARHKIIHLLLRIKQKVIIIKRNEIEIYNFCIRDQCTKGYQMFLNYFVFAYFIQTYEISRMYAYVLSG